MSRTLALANTIVIAAVLAVVVASVADGATPARTTMLTNSPKVTADLEKTTLTWLASHTHLHYPGTWKEGVECHIPQLIHPSTRFSCIVFFDEPGVVIPLVEGSAHDKVRTLTKAHGGYNISFGITPQVRRYVPPIVTAPASTTSTLATTTTSPPTSTAP